MVGALILGILVFVVGGGGGVGGVNNVSLRGKQKYWYLVNMLSYCGKYWCDPQLLLKVTMWAVSSGVCSWLRGWGCWI